VENYNIENIQQVLERAKSAAPTPPSGDGASKTAAQLREFIGDEAEDAAMYTLLAIKTKGSPAQQVLNGIAADERQHEKRLQAEYFMLTGDTFSPKVGKPSAPFLLPALRQRYIGETSGAEAYEKAAKETQNASLRALYFELARDERRHARSIRSLIDRLIC
jgi:rubrerythrin